MLLIGNEHHAKYFNWLIHVDYTEDFLTVIRTAHESNGLLFSPASACLSPEHSSYVCEQQGINCPSSGFLCVRNMSNRLQKKYV